MTPLANALQVRYPKLAEAIAAGSAPHRRLVCQALGLTWEAEDRAILREYREAKVFRHETLRHIESDL